MALHEVYVDGASRGQGSQNEDGTVERLGHGAAAAMIYRNKKLIGQYARGLGKVPNNVAEYEAIILGLLMCWAADLERPIIYCDSSIVVKQINGDWQCKSERLIPLLKSVQEIEQVYQFNVVHVPRSHVAEADKLANKFLNSMLEKPKKRKEGKKRAQTPKKA